MIFLKNPDAVTGTWKQTDEMDGDWTWTFSNGSKVNLEGWSAEKEYDYTLDGDVLDLKETYSSFHLIKQK